MTLKEAYDIVFDGAALHLDQSEMERVAKCYDFLEHFAHDKVIYGINTGFGPMAQWRVEDEHLKELQYNIIRSHATGAGEPLSQTQVRAAMVARANTFMQARSGIHPDTVRLIADFVNRGVVPYVPSHGSVGASGDLVQLAHIALTLIGEGTVYYDGKQQPASDVMAELGLRPMQIHVREGLAVVNGTAVMTGIGIVNQRSAERLLERAILASAWINEIAASYDDYMSIELNEPRRQRGQQIVAAKLREYSRGSRRLVRREHVLYSDAQRGVKVFEHKVQAYYSLRCIPQILGPVLESVESSADILERELNSACDNPIIDYEAENVLHGGNFHGDYVSLEQDKLKIALVRMTMTAERQLNYLFHDRINGILPPFLNMGVRGLNYGMQACQFTATSTTAESQTLAMPNYVHSIPNNNDNQDIVSMGTNTALLTARVIENACQVLSILYIALAQATDCLDIADDLAPASRKAYDEIRALTPIITDDTPFYEDIAKVGDYLLNTVVK